MTEDVNTQTGVTGIPVFEFTDGIFKFANPADQKLYDDHIREVYQKQNAELIALQAEERATALMAEKEHAANILALAGELVGKKGLPVAHDNLVAFLEKLPVELYPEGEALLTAAAERAPINFNEAGHSRTVQGTKPLPDTIKPALKSWLDKGLSLESFFETNAVELGLQTDYDLTEYLPKE